MTPHERSLATCRMVLVGGAVGLLIGLTLGALLQWITGSTSSLVIFAVLGPTVLGPALARIIGQRTTNQR